MKTQGSALVVGGGVAALAAARELAELDVEVTVLSPTEPAHWPTVPESGIPVGDDLERAIDDTLAAGEHRAARAPVRALARGASAVVEDLARLGVPFEREGAEWHLRRLPGMSQPGAAHVGAHTELAIAAALERLLAARWGALVSVHEPWALMSLIVADGQCRGAVCRDVVSDEIRAFTADVVVLAGGGPEKLLGARCGHLCAEAALAIAAEHGAVVADMHLCQQHPAALTTERGLVIPSGALRCEGARLWVPQNPDDVRPPEAIPKKERLRYLEVAYPDWSELVPDRLGARHGWEHGAQLYLDMSHLPERQLQQRLGSELEALRLATRYDPTRTALSVSPAPMGMLGGLWVDHQRADDGGLDETSARNHATSVAGLYAVGGLASLYHGTCQLGGNRLLADLFGARLGALAAHTYLTGSRRENIDAAVAASVASCDEEHGERTESGFGPEHLEIVATLREGVADLLGAREYVVADTAGEIVDLEAELEALPPAARAGAPGAAALHDIENMFVVAKMIASAALAASRNGHQTRVLQRVADDEVTHLEQFELNGRTVTGIVDEDGIPSATREYT